ncbi:hypothetical protein F3M38_21525, partial [Salmonella enterica subsp. enterica serovar Anatum]|nr:hypothetical protein [Salmonella enterica]ECB6460815.1 hypothetical protein [Salmonella enterica subsp. enterica serovar Anatum]EEE2985663.1 hypothetical protein [Salmonella enterica subsp. enterica serovar Eko]EAZ3778120.1 hypothetical protein [Salmonella enterica]EBC1198477.1 hypothetical protein [Salmonella enterica]
RHYKMPAVHTLNYKPVLLIVYAGHFKLLNGVFNSIKVFRPKKHTDDFIIGQYTNPRCPRMQCV